MSDESLKVKAERRRMWKGVVMTGLQYGARTCVDLLDDNREKLGIASTWTRDQNEDLQNMRQDVNHLPSLIHVFLCDWYEARKAFTCWLELPTAFQHHIIIYQSHVL
jgi:hypothetical protein